MSGTNTNDDGLDPKHDVPVDPNAESGHPTTDAERIPTGPALFHEIQQSAKFRKLRRSFRLFAFPTVVAVLAWYFLYVLLSTFAESFMSIPVIGNLNIGILFGLAQFPTTWFATWLYVRRADNILDPLAAELRAELESKEIR